jgi:NTE family protein
LASALSGGGYRAMLYHLGALQRLNEFGLLSVMDRHSAVSGGSLAGAVLGLQWSSLSFDAKGVAAGFEGVER